MNLEIVLTYILIPTLIKVVIKIQVIFLNNIIKPKRIEIEAEAESDPRSFPISPSYPPSIHK